MKKASALLSILAACALIAAACSKSQQTSTTSETSAPATMAAQTTSAATSATKAALPIAASKLPSLKIAAGNAAAGAQVFAANCESCHGAKGIGGGIGPKLAGSGLTAGQVAFMVRKPQAIDKTSSMPALQLTDKQVADVSAYVASLK